MIATGDVPRWRSSREIADMKGFADNIEKLTEENDNFREVLYTGKSIQLVLMAIQAGEEIGEEIHEDRDQFFRFETGTGEVWIDGVANQVKSDDGVIVPAGAKHNVVNTGSEPLTRIIHKGVGTAVTGRFLGLFG